jgi:signal peptidase I
MLFGSILSTVLQPFNIPSGSMKPTLLVGDYMFSNSLAYGIDIAKDLIFPMTPSIFLGAEPARGDLVLFRLPRDDETIFIMRLVGLPGDRIQMTNGALHINGEPVKRQRIEDYIETEEGTRATRVKRWREVLPNGVTYTTLDLIDNGFYDNTPVYEVPSGHFFVLGDNRDNATDSRVLSQVGYIPFDNLVGKPWLVYFSMREGEWVWKVWRWSWTVRWERLFTRLR